MRNKINKVTIVVMMLLCPLGSFAQSDDFGAWFSAGVVKKIDKRFNVGVEAEYRLRDDLKTSDRWSVGVDADYKLTNWLKASVGYTFLNDNNEKNDKYTYFDSEDDIDEDTGEPYGYYGKVKKIVINPNYWGKRHRFNVSLTGSIDIGRLNVSLRERWQYTYRPAKTVTRETYEYSYSLDGVLYDDYPIINNEEKTYKGKGKNVLRSRLMLEYNIPHCKVDPFVSVETYNAWSLYKTRYTIGADWKIAKPQTLSFYYRYQHVKGSDDFDSDPNMHIIGLGYKYKF